MNQGLFLRVKNALNLQYYSMNDSWLQECIEYYLNEHESPMQTEVITFVINQWMLCDLREINNDNGCLPKNLAQQKCTTLHGKYILQMEKIYDISTSKYKQLEKMRNVSSDINIKTTEEENETQEDKFLKSQTTPKRMLQLFLTDGVQDVLAIEYRPIKSLNGNLFPGIKVMIKGPIICRKGVILLEEVNFSEIGGEVDSLLIPNALENVLARALNLEENTDPYNDCKKIEKETQNMNSVAMEDDFEIDSQVIDQIEKQIEEQTSNVSRMNIPNRNKEQNQMSKSRDNINNFQRPLSVSSNETKNLTDNSKNQQLNSNNNLNNFMNSIQKKTHRSSIQNNVTDFENHDSFSDMFDDNIFESLPISKHSAMTNVSSSTLSKRSSSTSTKQSPIISSKRSPIISNRHTPNKSGTKKQLLSKFNQYENENDFPMNNEIYDVENFTSNRHSSIKSTKSTSSNSSIMKQSSLKFIKNENENDFPIDDEIYDVDNSTYANTPITSTKSKSRTSSTKNSSLKFIKNENENDFPIDDEIYDVDNSTYANTPITSTKSKSRTSSTKNSSLKFIKNENENDFPIDDKIYDVDNSTYANTPITSTKSKSRTSSTKNSSLKFIKNENENDFPVDDEIYDESFTCNRRSPIKSMKNTSSTTSSKKQSTLKFVQNKNKNDSPLENKVYDLTEECSSFFPLSKSNESHKMQNLLKKSDENVVHKQNTSCRSEKSMQMNISPKKISNNCNKNAILKFPSPLKSMNDKKLKTGMSNYTSFADSDFAIDDFDINTDNYSDYFNKNNKTNVNKKSSPILSKASTSNLNVNTERSRILFTNSSTDSSGEIPFDESNSFKYIENEFENEFDFQFENEKAINNRLSNSQQKDSISQSKLKKIKSSTITSENKNTNDIIPESTKNKRLANTPPGIVTPQKIRRLEDSPQPSCSSDKKVTNSLCDSPLSNSYIPNLIELICDVLKQPLTDEAYITTVRGKVVNIVKLNLFKGEDGPYFHLESTITDFTASLDIVFSSKVLENLIGYTSQEFSLKRKQSKIDPQLKDHLRDDLKKAQQTLRVMDAFMDIELRKNKKIKVLKIKEMTEDQRNFMNFRISSLIE